MKSALWLDTMVLALKSDLFAQMAPESAGIEQLSSLIRAF
jgi:hypothetical protein